MSDYVYYSNDTFEVTQNKLRILQHTISMSKIESAHIQVIKQRAPGMAIAILSLLPIFAGGVVLIGDQSCLDVAFFCVSAGLVGFILGLILAFTAKPAYQLTLATRLGQTEAFLFNRAEDGEKLAQAINEAIRNRADGN